MKFPKSFIRRFLPDRIWQQVFFMLSILVVVPLVILGTLLIRTSQNSIKTTVLRDYKQIAVNASGKAEAKIKDARQALHVASSILGALPKDLWRQETAIVELALQYPIFQRVSSVNLQGKEVATSELGTPLQNRAHEESFSSAVAGQDYISDVTIASDHMPVIKMAVPIRRLGKVSGALMAEVNIRGIWDIIDSIQLGKTGKAYLIDQEGRIIAHPDKKKILEGSKPEHNDIIQDVLSGKTRSLEIKDKDNKPEALIAFAPIKSLKWGLIIDQSAKEAFASSKVMKTQAWVLILISVFAAMAMSFVLAKFISHPMKELIERTSRLARGDLAHSFRIQRKDEVGRLLFSFNRMARKLQTAQKNEKLSLVGRAATTIAHELKNSLHLINTFIELLPKRHKDKQFINEFSDVIPRELESWNRMLKNMIDFSRSEKVPMTLLNMNVFLSEVIDLAKYRVSLQKIYFETSIQEDLPGVLGNASKLKQVLLNLLTNCIEATPRDGKIMLEAGVMESSLLRAEPHLEIKVVNSGEGISQPDEERIFEPFYTTKKQGLGIGLSISNEIVKQHGGNIAVTSEKNTMTMFSIQLPVAVSCVKDQK